MFHYIQELLQSVLEDRGWSWAIIGIAAILTGLICRHGLVGDLLAALKAKNKTWYKRTQERYLSKSVIGWILFLLSIAGFVMIWRNARMFSGYMPIQYWIILFAALMACSYMAHLRAYMRSMIESIHENVPSEKELTRNVD